MAAVKVTLTGVLIDLYGRTISGPLKFVGDMVRTDVGVGGGPIIPPEGGGEPPVGIWPGPGDPDFPAGAPHPEHPIVIPKPPEGPPPHPEHPIVLPPDQGGQPPADASWVWGWNARQGWHPVYVPPPGSQTPH